MTECKCGQTHYVSYKKQFPDKQSCRYKVGERKGWIMHYDIGCGKDAAHIFYGPFDEWHSLCEEHFQKLAVEKWGMESI